LIAAPAPSPDARSSAHDPPHTVEGRIIVCLASRWDYDPTSKHQVMRALARCNHVVWVNYHGTRRPRLHAHDLGAAWSALRRVARGVERISPTMVQMTPLVIPGAQRALARRLHRRLLIAQLRRAVRSVVRRIGPAPLQVWTFAPDVPYLVGALDEECFVYYCVDEYSEFEGFDRESIVRAERELLDRADVVVTTSEALLRSRQAVRTDTVLVPHGVDFDHFATAWRRELPRPGDLAGIEGPMFGFFGLIHHWIDLPLIAEVARRRPGYAFVLIGDAKVDTRPLRGLPNVHLLGRRAYDALPAYCQAFTAGLLPFVHSAMTRNINPIKMYEYLAAGLPVVSTDLPEARPYATPRPIRIADTPEAFAEACDAVAAEHPAPKSPDTCERISASVRDRSWAEVVRRLCDVIRNRIAERSTRSEPPR
jgi:glycosyltransferase involved in cell wall biosynthesis